MIRKFLFQSILKNYGYKKSIVPKTAGIVAANDLETKMSIACDTDVCKTIFAAKSLFEESLALAVEIMVPIDPVNGTILAIQRSTMSVVITFDMVAVIGLTELKFGVEDAVEMLICPTTGRVINKSMVSAADTPVAIDVMKFLI